MSLEPSPAKGRTAFVLKGYPRLSETFIAQEILALEERGLDILIVSLRHPTDQAIHPVHRQIRAGRLYLPEYLYQEPLRVLRGWWRGRRLSGYRAARRAWLADLRRDPTLNRIRRFGQALVLAAELPGDIDRLHAHFLHTPASVTRYAAAMRGLEWSVSAHAKDIWTTPDWEKREKLRSAAWAVTCTAAGRRDLLRLLPDEDRVLLAYHGIDLQRFPPPAASLAPRDGDAAGPVAILSVGRLVAKKGYDDLLAALALLPKTLDWRLTHIGGGGLGGKLKAEAVRLGIGERIEWRGAQPQPEVLAAYRQADIFVLASKIAADGDRDGLPNVLMEAQSQALACVGTAVPGIGELIEDGRTGLLAQPGDPPGLAALLERLIAQPALRFRLAEAGQTRVRSLFGSEPAIATLAARFGVPAAAPRPPAGETLVENRRDLVKVA